MQVPTSSVLSLFTVVWSSETAHADLWGGKRVLGHSSLQGHIFTAVLGWPVNLRIITHSALQANLSCSLHYLLWLGLLHVCCCLHLLDAFLLSLSVFHTLCLLLLPHVGQLLVEPLVTSSTFWPCHVSPGTSCYAAIALELHPTTCP